MLIDKKPGVAFYLVSSFVDFERRNAVGKRVDLISVGKYAILNYKPVIIIIGQEYLLNLVYSDQCYLPPLKMVFDF